MGRPRPFLMLIGAVALISVFQAVYAAVDVEPSRELTSLWSTSLALAMVIWADADARSRRRVPCHDFGFLLALFFPVSLCWYVFWSRGRRGIGMLAALSGLMLLPWLLALTAWLWVQGHLQPLP